MMLIHLIGPGRFETGHLVCTRSVIREISEVDVAVAFNRHRQGDWGLVCEEDRLENGLSLEHHYRLMSVYENSEGRRFWIITEADRSATTVLLPEEY